MERALDDGREGGLGGRRSHLSFIAIYLLFPTCLQAKSWLLQGLLSRGESLF